MIYLLALSDFSGAVNLTADGIFLACTFVSLWQVGYRTSLRHAVYHAAAADERRANVG